MTVLTDPRYVVPPLPAPAGRPLDELRRAVPRFATGPAHEVRRAEAVRLLSTLDPDSLRAATHTLTLANPAAPADRADRAESVDGADPAGRAGRAGRSESAGRGGRVGGLGPGVPLTVLAAALGVVEAGVVAGLVPAVAAAYFPGTGDEDAADAALARLAELGVDLVRVGLLVQACAPVAALVRAGLERGLVDPVAVLAEELPVPATRRSRVDTGEVVTVPLAGTPFGAGPHRCPAEAPALALAAGVLAAMAARRAGPRRPAAPGGRRRPRRAGPRRPAAPGGRRRPGTAGLRRRRAGCGG